MQIQLILDTDDRCLISGMNKIITEKGGAVAITGGVIDSSWGQALAMVSAATMPHIGPRPHIALFHFTRCSNRHLKQMSHITHKELYSSYKYIKYDKAALTVSKLP